MRVSADPADAGALQLDLTQEHSWTAVRRPMVLEGENTTTWYGDVVGGGYALFVRHDGFLHGIVQTNGETFKVSPIDRGLCAVQRVAFREADGSVCDSEGALASSDTVERGVPASGAEPRQASRSGARVTDEPFVIIDALVAYESTVTQLIPDVIGHIEFLTAWANLSYINSRIHTAAGPCWQGERCLLPQLRVVVTTALECPRCAETSLTNLFLNNRFALKDDGWFDEVHVLRDEEAADVCVLLTELDRPVTQGTSKMGPSAEWAFCLAETPFSLLYPWIYAHEIGHLQGAGHESGSHGREYARGHCHNPSGGEPAERFSTIMCTSSLQRIPYWSNPELDYEPVPGRTFPLGDPTHNNARRLNETSLMIASHRGAVVTPVDVADFAARVAGDEARLTWRFSQPALDELSGVHVQRAALAGGPYENRTSAALRPAPVMSWVDAQLPRGRASWYRLQLIPANGAPETVGPVQVSALPWTSGLQHPQVVDERVVVRYSVGPAPAVVRLGVYDVRGRLVRVLDQGRRGAGEFEVVWDRRDDGGRLVARGVYMLQLTTDDEQSVRKLLLLSN
jgi:hypothetical protein